MRRPAPTWFPASLLSQRVPSSRSHLVVYTPKSGDMTHRRPRGRTSRLPRLLALMKSARYVVPPVITRPLPCHPPSTLPPTPHTRSSTSHRPTRLLHDATTTPGPATHTHRPTASLAALLAARAGHAGVTCDVAHLRRRRRRCRPTSHLRPMPSPHPTFSLYHAPPAPVPAPYVPPAAALYVPPPPPFSPP